MKILAIFALIVLTFTGTAFAQEKSCSFNLVGTWKVQLTKTDARLYTFDDSGNVKILEVAGTAEPKEIATAKYSIDPETPEVVSFKASGKNRIFGRAKATMTVEKYDDVSLTCSIPGAGTTRWTKVDPNRYFIVLAARTEEFYDHTGSAFPVLIKLSNGAPEINAVGIYSDEGKPHFGTVPPETYKNYLREARGDSETVLRLEINGAQYDRSLMVVKEWQRRAREDALLYRPPTSPVTLNNILLVKAVTETLNQCSDDVSLYKLNYVHPQDWLTDKYSPELVPFYYFKELRRLNEARHISDQKFQEIIPSNNLAVR
ncbi:MAG TPA: hypothetical protein VFT30_01930 [Nitrospira sp.]|nr:hypothetical protein [Nitrospira sp.]